MAVTLSEGGVTAGTAVTVTTTLNDTRFNNQNGTEPTQAIQAGALYVDTPPWEVGGGGGAVDGR
ncbi:MAG: hypothetical protein M5U34_39645 [Chloroflexi bacterium]|nr:hypothetical protein [Chloroflexota bacterium]